MNNLSITEFLIEQKRVLETMPSRSNLLSYYNDLNSSVKEIQDFFYVLKMENPIPFSILIASKSPNPEKLSFVEFGLENLYGVDFEFLKLNWGSFAISDQRERDRVVVIVFKMIEPSLLSRIELITRSEVEISDKEIFIESAKFLF